MNAIGQSLIWAHIEISQGGNSCNIFLKKYEYQPGDSSIIHVMEQISCTFCKIVSTKIYSKRNATFLNLRSLVSYLEEGMSVRPTKLSIQNRGIGFKALKNGKAEIAFLLEKRLVIPKGTRYTFISAVTFLYLRNFFYIFATFA